MRHYISSIAFLILASIPTILSAQCENNIQYPQGLLIAPIVENDTLIISEIQYAGDFCTVDGFISGSSYIVGSSITSDYFTIRSVVTGNTIAHGPTPLIYNPIDATTIEIHTNLSNPPCGVQNTARETFVVNQGLVKGRIGIKNNSPTTALDVNGKVKIGDDDHSPIAGAIRFNDDEKDFEGFDGMKWRSLTQGFGEWGKHHTPKVIERRNISREDSIQNNIGRSIALDNNIAIINAYNAPNGLEGKALIYENINRDTPVVTQLYEQSASSLNIFANGGVDIKNGRVIIGTLPSTNAIIPIKGSATIYHKTNGFWHLEGVLKPDTFEVDFGNKLSIFEPYAVVSGGINQGVYVYQLNNKVWSLLQEIDDHSNDHVGGFGTDVQINEDRLFISAPHRVINNKKGVIYTYELNPNGSFQLQDSIISPNHDNTAGFGSPFKVDSNLIVIASPFQTYQNHDKVGYAAVFHYDGISWLEDAIFVAFEPSFLSTFATSLDIDNQLITIGIDDNTNDSQVLDLALVYQRKNSDWELEAKLLPSNLNDCKKFASKVAISNGTILVSDPFQEVVAEKFGRLYIYQK